ncbi:MAG: hypothetical protein OXN19_16050 [Caldilineaceae bacterium]|nr:hypothetical protein [Caldilineaceae bacterium]
MPHNQMNLARLMNCVLIAYLDNGGEMDNQALLNYVRPIITSEYNVDRKNLGRHLVDARNGLHARRLIEKVNDNPGAWRLTTLGVSRAQFVDC